MTLTFTFNLPFSLTDATSSLFKPKFTNFLLFKTKFYPIPSNLSLLNQKSLFLSKTQMKSLVICARNKKRRTGYRGINRFVLDSVYLFATKSDILPGPLALLVKESGGGKGGGVKFFKGFGGGGFFKNNKNLLFLGFVMVFGFLMWLGLGKRLELCGLFLVILVLISFGCLIGKCWNKGFKDWVQGVCGIAAVGFLGLRKENLQRVMKGSGEIINSRRRKRGRAM